MAEEATHAIDQMATASRAASMTSVQSAHTALTGLSIRSYRSGRVTKRTPGMSMRVLRAVGLAAKAETESVALVIGSGHLGTFLACQLAEAGVKTVLKTGRSEVKAPVKALCGAAGVELIDSLAAMYKRPVSHVFVCVKTFSLQAVAAEMFTYEIAPKCVVVVHNGFILSPFTVPSISVVVPQGYDFVQTEAAPCGWSIAIRNEDKPWIMPFTEEAIECATFLNNANVLAVAHPQYAYMQLRKYFINGVANLLAIVTSSNCTQLTENHKARMEALYAEMVEVLKDPHAEGFVHMPKNFKKLVFDGVASYGSHYPSSKHDFDGGGQIEVESLNGYIVLMAKKQGIAAPANTRLVKQVNSMVRRRDRSGVRKDLEEKLEGVVQVVLTLVAARCLAVAVRFLPGNTRSK